MKPFTLPLSDSQATLENVGGTGMSLVKMIQAGVPIPDGFHVTTEAYCRFIAENNLQTKILDAREYGIPDALATGVGTRHIHYGQAITADGSAGTVTLDSM